MKLLTTVLLYICLTSFLSLNDKFEVAKIIYTKKKLGTRAEYTIDIPVLNNTNKSIIKCIGKHGYGFHIIYSNHAEIYYNNDWATMTPNYENYQTINYRHARNAPDTIINGLQNNDLYWKEIKKGSTSIGYLNIPEADKHLFEQSILTLKQTR